MAEIPPDVLLLTEIRDLLDDAGLGVPGGTPRQDGAQEDPTLSWRSLDLRSPAAQGRGPRPAAQPRPAGASGSSGSNDPARRDRQGRARSAARTTSGVDPPLVPGPPRTPRAGVRLVVGEHAEDQHVAGARSRLTRRARPSSPARRRPGRRPVGRRPAEPIAPASANRSGIGEVPCGQRPLRQGGQAVSGTRAHRGPRCREDLPEEGSAGLGTGLGWSTPAAPARRRGRPAPADAARRQVGGRDHDGARRRWRAVQRQAER